MDDSKEVIETGFLVAIQVQPQTPMQRSSAAVEVLSGDRVYEFAIAPEKAERLIKRLQGGDRLRVALVVLPEKETP